MRPFTGFQAEFKFPKHHQEIKASVQYPILYKTRGAPAWVGAKRWRCKVFRFRSKSQIFKALKGCKRLPRGRQALPGGAAGWNMMFRFSHYAGVFGNNS